MELVGKAGGGASSELGKKTFRRSLKRGMKVTLSFLTSRICHLPAGSPMGLLGPCWVRWHCVQKSAPQVRQAGGGVGGNPWDHQEWVLLWLREQREEGRQVMSLKEGRLQALSILRGALGNRIIRLDSLSWVLPQEGAEYLTLTPKHIDSYLILGHLELPFRGLGSPGCCVRTISSPSSHFVSSPHFPIQGQVLLVFLRAGAGVGGGGMKAVAPDNAGSPLTRIGRAEGGGTPCWLSPTRRAGRRLPLQSGERAGAEPRECESCPGPLRARWRPRGASGAGAAQQSARRRRVRAAGRMAGAAGGARATRPGLHSELPQLRCLPGGPPHRSR